MGGQKKKEYIEYRGKPVLVRALEPFFEPPSFHPVIVTVPPGHTPLARELCAPFVRTAEIRFVEGGGTRQESVFKALRACAEYTPGFVLIHDGARPWLTRALVDAVCENTVREGACIPVVRVADALKELDAEGYIVRHLAHDRLRGAQTPQGFAFEAILNAHEKAANAGILAPDDAELYAEYCGKVFTVSGDPANIKITYAHDMERW